MNQNHFVVLPPQKISHDKPSGKLLVADPAHGLVSLDRETFLKNWISSGDQQGIVLMLEPTPDE
jgi:ATP-binding cassette subfamily B protein